MLTPLDPLFQIPKVVTLMVKNPKMPIKPDIIVVDDHLIFGHGSVAVINTKNIAIVI